MMGDVAISDPIQVTDHGFTRGDIYQVAAKTGIVGNVMMLKIKMTNSESEPFMCNKIQIILAYKLWEFPCTDLMYKLPNKKSFTLSVAGRTGYHVKIKVTKACADPVWMEIQGSEGGTLMTVLSDHGFNVGEFPLEL